MTSEQICKIGNISWTSYHEDLLIDWADKAKCYKWLHDKSHKNFKCMNTWFTIPVIILSTATGTANFAQYRLEDPETKSYAPIAIGIVNIFTGILTTIQQFLRINELNESHRVSSIGWDKFYRNIKVELSKHPDEREHVGIITKTSKEEFDRLIETSPDIDGAVVNDFIREFSGKQTYCCGYFRKVVDANDVKNFMNMKKPDICGSLQSTADFRHPWNIKTKYDDIEVEIMEQTKITLNAKNKILAIEDNNTNEDNIHDEITLPSNLI